MLTLCTRVHKMTDRQVAVAALSAGAVIAAIGDLLRGLRLRPTGAVVTELCRYPIKSLSRETLDSVVVAAECAFPGDREWAILRGEHLHEHDPTRSRWLHKAKFHVAMLDEQLSALRIAYSADTQRLEARDQADKTVLDAVLGTDDGRQKAERYFAEFLGTERLNCSAEGVPLRLVRSDVPGHCFHNHNGQVGDQVVHIVNLETVRALQAKMEPGSALSPYRFRANIYIDGLAAWEELGWVGRKIQIGDVEMEVECPTIRCPATQVCPETGRRDMASLFPGFPQAAFPNLQVHRPDYSRPGAYVGIYAKITNGGELKPGLGVHSQRPVPIE